MEVCGSYDLNLKEEKDLFESFIDWLDVYLPNRDKNIDIHVYGYRNTMEKLKLEWNILQDHQRVNLLLKDGMHEYCAQLVYNYILNKKE